MTMMASNPLQQVREVMLRGTSLTSEEHRRDVLSQAELFKAALAQLDAVREQAVLEGRGLALRRLSEMKAELAKPLRWIAEAEGAPPPPLPSGYCDA